MKAIDIWVNLFTPEALQKTFSAEEFQVAAGWWGLSDLMKGMPAQQFIAMMDEAGVEKSFIPAMKMKSWMNQKLIIDQSVEEVAEVVSLYPDRLAGLYGIDPFSKMKGVRELERSVKECGFIGAHLHTYGFGLPLNHRMYYPFYAKCVELDIPVEMQVGHSAETMPSDTGRPILLDDIALDFPELRLIGCHTGWPWVEELVAMAWKHPNIYVSTTAHAPKFWDPSLVRFIATRGRDKALWGTDYPVTQPKKNLEQLETLNFNEETKKKFLYENAVKVFKLK